MHSGTHRFDQFQKPLPHKAEYFDENLVRQKSFIDPFNRPVSTFLILLLIAVNESHCLPVILTQTIFL